MRKYGHMILAVAALVLVGITAVTEHRWVMQANVHDTIPVELMSIGIEHEARS